MRPVNSNHVLLKNVHSPSEPDIQSSTGEASAIAPFDYSRLLFTGIIGLAFFSEVPDSWTVAGAALIVASTIYIARREARLNPAPSAVPAESAADI